MHCAHLMKSHFPLRRTICLMACLLAATPAIAQNRPLARSDSSFAVIQGGTMTVDSTAALHIIKNDVLNGDSVRVDLVENVQHGQLDLLPSDGSFIYKHDSTDTRSDYFRYRLINERGEADTATVFIRITPPLIARHDIYPVPVHQPLTRIDQSTKLNDIIAKDVEVVVEVVNIDTPGSFDFNGIISTGRFSFSQGETAPPSGGLLGSFTYRLKLTDGSMASNEATVVMVTRPEYRCLEEIRRLEQNGRWEGAPVSHRIAIFRQGACQRLAFQIERTSTGEAIVTAFRTAPPLPDLNELISPRDLQSRGAFAADNSGAISAGQATTASEPIALVAGSASALGSDGGVDGITAMTLNPSMLFTDINDARETSKWGRIADVTVLFPLNDLTNTSSSNTDTQGKTAIQYLGLRSRINITALSAAEDIYDSILAKYQEINNASANNITKIKDILLELPEEADMAGCVDALFRAANGTASASIIDSFCQTAFAFDRYAAQLNELNDVINAAIEKADASHIGLNLGVDFGDPTLGALPNAAATAIQANLAFGRKLNELGHLRGRLGFRFQDLRDFTDDSFTSIEGGLGYEIRKHIGFQQINLAAGLDFRYNVSGANASIPRYQELLQTDYAYFRLSLSIPVTDLYQISVSYGAPLDGQLGPAVSINANWRLLLPDLAHTLGRFSSSR